MSKTIKKKSEIPETAKALEEARAEAEERLTVIMDKAVKAFIAKADREMQKAVKQTPMDRLAASAGSASAAASANFASADAAASGWNYGSDGLPTLSSLYGWWEVAVSKEVKDEIYTIFNRIYVKTATTQITKTSMDGLQEYMANVSDRLVRGIQPPLPEAAMNKVRVAVTQSAVEGWSRKDLGQRIAAELSWETEGAYWRAQKLAADSKIDTILDAVGKPGDALRESMKTHDPIVSALIRDRNLAISHLDAEEAYWKTRSLRIARTEATGAHNFGHLRALHDENWPAKTWVASHDNRTRETHADADGQTVKIGESFNVGGWLLQMPGAPSGPAEEIINCRCTVIGNNGSEVDELF